MARAIDIVIVSLLLEPQKAPQDTAMKPEIVVADSAPSLKILMSATARPAIKSQDFDKLTTFFQAVATFAPNDPQFDSWNSIAAAGLQAANARDLDAVRDACQSCHGSHRTTYRAWNAGR